METIINVFNIISSIINNIISSFIEIFNTIPLLFQDMGDWLNNLFPSDFAVYMVALIPIITTLLIIRFVKG